MSEASSATASRGPHALAIVNPSAGDGSMLDAFRRAEHDLLDLVGELDVAFTSGPGHATELARAALGRGVRQLLVAGGDGTINEVVNGWLDEAGVVWGDEATLVLLAGGTGGDLRRSLGIPDMSASLDSLRSGRTRMLDVGRLAYTPNDGGQTVPRYFVNIASFGLSGLVDRHVTSFSAIGGRLAYAAATARSLFGWRNPRVRLTTEHDNGERFEADIPIVAVAVANGATFGGGMRIAPDAVLDDGHFHVTAVGDLRKRDMLGLAGSLYDGSHVDHPKVLVKTAQRVTADSDEAVYLDVDGEPLGRLPAQFELVPGVLRVAVP